jgi:hypothetical protein
MATLQQLMLESTRNSLEQEAALHQTMLESNRNCLEQDAKFDKLSTPDEFDWWILQICSHLAHEAWNGILNQDEPCTTCLENRSLSNKLAQRLTAWRRHWRDGRTCWQRDGDASIINYRSLHPIGGGESSHNLPRVERAAPRKR